MTRQPPSFDQAFQDQFEQLLIWRRDVRRFLRDPIDPALVEKLLAMACLAPSVGNAQPWRFVTVDDPARREAVRENFVACNADALNDYSGDRAKMYASLKLSGMDDAPVHVAVFSDHETPAGLGLGRKTMPETLDYSVVSAIHTLWLAARIHGLGVGWVSIVEPQTVRTILDVPESWTLVAYLCIGKPVEESDEPELIRFGWQGREDFSRLVIRR